MSWPFAPVVSSTRLESAPITNRRETPDASAVTSISVGFSPGICGSRSSIAVVTGKLVTAVITPAPAGMVNDAVAVELAREPFRFELAVVGAPIKGFARTVTAVPEGMFAAERLTATGPDGAVWNVTSGDEIDPDGL